MEISIGKNIKQNRVAKKLTQEELAEMFNVSAAAVSKWENGETYPDITLLFPLASFFGISIDELMGYNSLKVLEELQLVKQQIHDLWVVNNDWEQAKAKTFEARKKFPNDYEIMIYYLFYLTGGQADNDPQVLIDNKNEINKVCDLILNGCQNEKWRLEALTYKAKVLFALGLQEEALEILNNFPSFYHSSNQRIEQLFSKDTDKFYHQLTLNIFELAAFCGNKVGKQIIYGKGLTNLEKANKVKKYYDIFTSLNTDRDFNVLIVFFKYLFGEVAHRAELINLPSDDNYTLWSYFNEAQQKILTLSSEDDLLNEYLTRR